MSHRHSEPQGWKFAAFIAGCCAAVPIALVMWCLSSEHAPTPTPACAEDCQCNDARSWQAALNGETERSERLRNLNAGLCEQAERHIRLIERQSETIEQLTDKLEAWKLYATLWVNYGHAMQAHAGELLAIIRGVPGPVDDCGCADGCKSCCSCEVCHCSKAKP